MNTFKKYSILFLFLLVFLSCGIEDYIYLNPVPAGNIDVLGNEYTSIVLPYSSSQSEYFLRYSVYYKIYLSSQNILGSISEGMLSSINSTLNSDYFAIKPYTNITASDTSISPSNIEYTFRNRNYNKIAVTGINIEDLLNGNADGMSMILDFTDTAASDDPTLTLNNSSYILRRSLDSGNFSPEPDYTFKNSSEIRDSNNIQFNRDVINASNATDCYVSLYIVKVGADNNFSPVYSFPTFIGIFRLPS
jgi:hypothetical protein